MQQWKDAVDNWEAKHEGKNPYELPLEGTFLAFFFVDLSNFIPISLGATEGDVRITLLEKEAELAKDGVPPLHTVTPTGFIVLGLELEDQQ